MKKYYSIILVLVVAIFLLSGTVSSQEKKGARITIEEPNFDFGFAPEGTYMAHEFVIKNTGDEALDIKRVRTTCGCTSAPVKKMNLEPDEETTITIVFNSTRYFHKTSKAAIISSNDPTRPSEKVTFIADMDTVKPRSITPNPRIIDLGKGDKFSRTATATIKNISESALTIQIIDYFSEFLDEPPLTAIPLPVGESVDVTVPVKEEIPAEEFVRASFTVAAMDKDGLELSRITIPVFGGGE